MIRPKELYDNAVPSGNSAAADVLLRLSLLTGDSDLERRGLSSIRLVRDALGRAPTAFGHALCALDLYLGPSSEVAIVGEADDPGTRALVDEVVAARFLPNTVVAIAGPGDARPPRRSRSCATARRSTGDPRRTCAGASRAGSP